LATLLLGILPSQAAQEIIRYIGRADEVTVGALETIVARSVREILAGGLELPEVDEAAPAVSNTPEEVNINKETKQPVEEDTRSENNNQQIYLRKAQVEDPVQAGAILENIRQEHPQLFQNYVTALQPLSYTSMEANQHTGPQHMASSNYVDQNEIGVAQQLQYQEEYQEEYQGLPFSHQPWQPPLSVNDALGPNPAMCDTSLIPTNDNGVLDGMFSSMWNMPSS
jgi:hypothetical protein